MQITLKNFKHAAFASEETYCFQATVYVDGIKVGVAGNDGHGGCTSIHFDEAHRGKFTQEQESAMEDAVDTECHKLVCEKQDKGILSSVKKKLAKDLIFTRKSKAGSYAFYKDCIGQPKEAAIRAKLKSDPDVELILNDVHIAVAAKTLYAHYKTA
jgi:hypothetical protein